MVRSVRDWRHHGVDIKVELATEGDLVNGGNETDMPFQSGGTGGAPYGWAASPSGLGITLADLNFTTAQGVASISNNRAVNQTVQGGRITSGTFPLNVGSKYQIGVQGRRMDSKAACVWQIVLEAFNPTTSTWYAIAVAQNINAADSWADTIATTASALVHTNCRIYIGVTSSAANALWGAQWQGLYLREIIPVEPITEWLDVTCDVRSIATRYGRERFTQRYDVSTLSIELLNDDGQYTYKNPHPLNLRPGRQVRVTATHEGVTYPMAYHIIDSIGATYTLDGHAYTALSCVDPSSLLADKATKASSAGQGGGLSGTRVNLLIDQVGYQLRRIDAGQLFTQAIVASDSSVRDEVGITGDSEGGSTFADRDGYITYKDRSWPTTDPHLSTVMADVYGMPRALGRPIVDLIPTDPDAPLIEYSELSTDWSMDRVVNFVELANRGGNVQTFINEPSFKANGPRTYQRLDFVLLRDVDLPIRAADLMDNWGDPVLRINSVSFAPGLSEGENVWPFCLSVFLNWAIRVWYAHPLNGWGYATVTRVQSVTHSIGLDDWEIVCTLDLPLSFVELFTGAFGWDVDGWDVAVWDDDSADSGAFWNSGQTWNDPNTKWGA